MDLGPLAGISMAQLEERLALFGALSGPCLHPAAVPVDLLVTGERVAWLCPGCDRQLPAAWGDGS